jgi:hypothetical protein
VGSIEAIQRKLKDIESIQKHLKVREQIHRDTQESTNSRIQMFTILEAVVLLSITVMQVLYVQGWFVDGQKRRV